MQLILYFFKKFRFLLLFLLLELISFFLTVQYHSYHKSKIVNSSYYITGSVYSLVDNITNFFYLKTENKRLLEENTFLKNEIEKVKINLQKTDSVSQQYHYKHARIINNNYLKINNILTLNKGKKHGVKKDMAVISSKGIVGVVKNTSSNFSTVLSVLSKQFTINVKIKNSNYFGSLIWNGKNYKTVQIEDMPRQAKIFIGDTVVVGNSAIFPKDVLIGTIKNFAQENNIYNKIEVTLFNDMSSLSYVKVIENKNKEEQETLEKLSNE